MASELENECMYYIQYKKQHNGNCVMWWALNDEGYTSNLFKAQEYTEEQVKKRLRKGQDRAWPVNYILGRVQQTVDMQYLKQSAAYVNKEK